MADLDNKKIDKVKEYINRHEGDTLIGQISGLKTEIDTFRSEIGNLTGNEEEHEDGLLGNLIDTLGNNKALLEYAKLALKDESSLTFQDKINMLRYEATLTLKGCNYLGDFKIFLQNLKDGGDVSRDTETHSEITPASTYHDDSENHNEQMQREENKRHPGSAIERSVIDKWRNKGDRIPEEKVHEVWNYINNGGTFYSPTRGTITWGNNKYKHVCSTGSYNVLWRLGFPKVSESLNVDLEGKILPRMGLNFIGTVDPDNPEKDGYKPQDGDTAVRPKFTRDSGHVTQHQATYINGSWVSDTIQNNMSCYGDRNEPRNVKIYRYTGEVSLA